MTSAPARLAVALLSAVLLVGGLPSVASAATIEDYAGYDGQSTCASEVLPGTAFLLRHLVRTHPGTRSSSLLRSCSGTSTSEHKDGRALDWGVDAAVPEEREAAYAWLRKIFATDKQGNRHALARRMGIMYVIWDDHIYSAYGRDGAFTKRLYTSCEPLSDCSKTARHRDHVHVSLSRAGAAAQTSFYRRRNVPSVPVLYPGTRKLDPVSTAEVTFTVPAGGETVTTDFKLEKGVGYRIVADGLVRTGPGSQVVDAACRWTADGWAPTGALRVGGTNPWPATCSDGHTYQATYTPTSTGFLKVRVDEDTPADAEGQVTFSLLRSDIAARTVATRRVAGSAEPRPPRKAGTWARALVTETLTVRADRARGALTTRSLRRRASYRVVVTGTATSGTTRFDGQCVRYAGRLRPQHTLDLTDPSADHLSVYIQGAKVKLRVPGSGRACNGSTHRYVGVFKPAVDGRSRVKVWDPYSYADNKGSLTVALRRR
ncbi:MAG TPA: hypothetical protein VFZ64_01330 [Nocardioidaceae bacterium]